MFRVFVSPEFNFSAKAGSRQFGLKSVLFTCNVLSVFIINTLALKNPTVKWQILSKISVINWNYYWYIVYIRRWPLENTLRKRNDEEDDMYFVCCSEFVKFKGYQITFVMEKSPLRFNFVFLRTKRGINRSSTRHCQKFARTVWESTGFWGQERIRYSTMH